MRKLLVVDDEADVCDFVKNFFEERGYAVLTALNGEDALAIVKDEKPNLITVPSSFAVIGCDLLISRRIRPLSPR